MPIKLKPRPQPLRSQSGSSLALSDFRRCDVACCFMPGNDAYRHVTGGYDSESNETSESNEAIFRDGLYSTGRYA